MEIRTRDCPYCGRMQYPCPVRTCVLGGWKHFGTGEHACQGQGGREEREEGNGT